jgi:hypothetical protein
MGFESANGPSVTFDSGANQWAGKAAKFFTLKRFSKFVVPLFLPVLDDLFGNKAVKDASCYTV